MSMDRKEYLRRYGKAYAKKKRYEAIELIAILKDIPCADCGQKFHHSVMDFDHGSNLKVGEVSVMARKSGNLERAILESFKCEVVCANCHRVRSYWKSIWKAAEEFTSRLPNLVWEG